MPRRKFEANLENFGKIYDPIKQRWEATMRGIVPRRKSVRHRATIVQNCATMQKAQIQEKAINRAFHLHYFAQLREG
jgi:hypothetical protein